MNRLYRLLAFFAASAHRVCLAVCVCCLHAGMVCQKKKKIVAAVCCLLWSLICLSVTLSACKFNTYHSTPSHNKHHWDDLHLFFFSLVSLFFFFFLLWVQGFEWSFSQKGVTDKNAPWHLDRKFWFCPVWWHMRANRTTETRMWLYETWVKSEAHTQKRNTSLFQVQLSSLSH